MKQYNQAQGKSNPPYLTSDTVTELSAMLVERMTCEDETTISTAGI